MWPRWKLEVFIFNELSRGRRRQQPVIENTSRGRAEYGFREPAAAGGQWEFWPSRGPVQCRRPEMTAETEQRDGLQIFHFVKLQVQDGVLPVEPSSCSPPSPTVVFPLWTAEDVQTASSGPRWRPPHVCVLVMALGSQTKRRSAACWGLEEFLPPASLRPSVPASN